MPASDAVHLTIGAQGRRRMRSASVHAGRRLVFGRGRGHGARAVAVKDLHLGRQHGVGEVFALLGHAREGNRKAKPRDAVALHRDVTRMALRNARDN